MAEFKSVFKFHSTPEFRSKIISTPEFSCILISLNARVPMSLNFFRVRVKIFIKQFQFQMSLYFFQRHSSDIFKFLLTPELRCLKISFNHRVQMSLNVFLRVQMSVNFF